MALHPASAGTIHQEEAETPSYLVLSSSAERQFTMFIFLLHSYEETPSFDVQTCYTYPQKHMFW